MKEIAFALTALKRDWCAGELRLVAIALVIAVTSVTSVGLFSSRIHRVTVLQAAELLAADLVLVSPDPIPAKLIEQAQRSNLRTAETLSFRSVAVAGDRLQLAEVKAVDSHYPLRGELSTATSLFGAASETRQIPQSGTAWVDGRMMQLLGVSVGDRIDLGVTQLLVSKVLVNEPDRGGELFNIAPRIMINLADVPATKLVQPASRVHYRLLLSGAASDIAAFRWWITSQRDPILQIQDLREGRPELRRAFERAEQFLDLASVVAVALAGLAIALATQRYVVRHLDNCAIMRCFGASQGFISRSYLIQLLCLGLATGIAGCGLGFLVQLGLSKLLIGLTPTILPTPSWIPLLSGVSVALITLLGFAIPHITRLRSVPPARVLRRDLGPLPRRMVTVYGAAIAALAMLVPWYSGDLQLTAYTLGALLATGILLAGSGWFVIKLLAGLRARVGIGWRFGVTNIVRRTGSSVAQIVALGLGIMVMLLLTLVRTDLITAWRDRLAPQAPNQFIINVQRDEVDAIRQLFRDKSQTPPILYPMVRGRLVTINEHAVDPDDYSEPRAQRLAEREFNLSWAESPQWDNQIIAGIWWKAGDHGKHLFSVEDGIATTLGIKLHDELAFQVAEREVKGKVSNLRRVEWDTFNVNFFVVANPGMLDGYPATYITSFHLPPGSKWLLNELITRFPSITILDVDALIEKAQGIISRAALAVEYVFVLTLLAGLTVLFAAIQTTHDERIHESALLRTLGATTTQLAKGLLAEFTCLGLVAGLLAAIAATLAGHVIATQVFAINYQFNPWLWLIGPSIGAVGIGLAGFLGTRSVLHQPPILTLRKMS
ncbi:MAG: ABC transporter permease [Gammaproteobacteria bacterium]|nr:ABC transporter permease [Gammaproteobacteria bacterium]MCI0591272.1 ABC transporter permease [Gammaproteobacteria bacterium]